MRRKPFNSINIVPLVDVVLVLLVITLTTATFISKGVIEVNLPKAKTTTNSGSKEVNVIIIAKDGKYYFNDKIITIEKLKDITKKESENTSYVIRSDKDSKFENFIKVIDILKEQKKKSIAIATIEKV